MLQKVIVVLVGLVMSLVGALSPSGLFASPADDAFGVAATGKAVEETLATVRTADGLAFSKVSVLWAEVDGRRVTEDAWGTGEVKELRFKVGVKEVEGVQLAVGDKLVPLKPTDIVTIRLFRGDFAYRGMGTPTATLQLQGTVQTTTLQEGAPTGKLRTENVPRVGSPATTPDASRVAYVVLSSGEQVDTVALEQGGARFFTEGSQPAPASEPGNLLAKWVKVDGRIVREYTWGDGPVGLIEFEPADAASRSATLSFAGEAADAPARTRVIVKDFVGEYLVYQVTGGLVRIKLDGYAADFTTGANDGIPSESSPGAPLVGFDISPLEPTTADVVKFHDRSTDDGAVVFWRWDFGDGVASALQDPVHRFVRPGAYNVTLTVTDDDLLTSEVSSIVLVENAAPKADFEWLPRVLTTESLVAFADLSVDTDGTLANWTWDFGDGSRAYTKSPIHQYRKSGQVTVTLTVVDDLGGRSTLAKSLLIRNHPPVASFAWSPVNPLSRVPMTFTSTSVDHDGGIVSWEWDFDGKPGVDAVGAVVAHTFLLPGPHKVTLTVTDEGGAVDTAAIQISVDNRLPEAAFSWGPSAPTVVTDVVFQNEASDTDGVVVLSEWTWGDGSSTRIVNTDAEAMLRDLEHNAGSHLNLTPTTHRFPAAGTYTVELCVVDNRGGKDCTTGSVAIEQAAPRAVLRVSQGPYFRGQEITFDTTASRDPDGQAIVFREVTYGDGGVTNAAISRHAYAELGTYPARAVVRDESGLEGFAVVNIVVQNALPEARIVQDVVPAVAGQPVTFSAVDVRDADGPVAAINYTWTFYPSGERAWGPTVSRTFGSTAAAQVRLVLRDGDGGTSQEIIHNFDVIVAPPTVSFTLSDDTPSRGQSVTLTDTSTSINGPIRSRSWTIGGQSVSTAASFQHTFNAAGPVDITLTVDDGVAPQQTLSRTIRVNTPPASIVSVSPTTAVSAGTALTFRDSSSDAEGTATIVRRAWDFGDGTILETADLLFDRAYSTPGTFLVRHTVEDDAGATHSSTLSVTVAGRRPVAAWHIEADAPYLRGQALPFVSDSYDPDGSPLTAIRWRFGDGTIVDNDATPTHAYAKSGLYTVSLEVGDGSQTSQPTANSVRAIRVGADHQVQVDISALLPHEGLRDLDDPLVQLTMTLGRQNSPSQTFTKLNLTEGAEPGHWVLTLPPGRWAEDDTLTVHLVDRLFMASANGLVQNVQLKDADSQVFVVFQLPMPLRAEIVAISDYDPPARIGAPAPSVLHTEDVVYDLDDPFHGAGAVEYADGVPAALVDVIVVLRYQPLESPAGDSDLRDGVSLPNLLGLCSFDIIRSGPLGAFCDGIPTPPASESLLGWCEATTTRTDAGGAFTWTVDEDSPCMLAKGDVHGLGHWQARAIARHSFATPAVSEPADFFVDPTGLFATSVLP